MSLKDAQNQHFKARARDWRLAKDFHQADDVTHYLNQGKYESEGAYQARRSMAKGAHPYTRQILSLLADQLLLRADEVQRDLGPIPSSYPDSAGPEGESHDIQMHKLGIYLLLFGESWLQVRPTAGDPELRIRTPLSVPRWKDEAVLTLGEQKKPNTPIDEPEETDTVYTIHRPEGWTSYMLEEKQGQQEPERVQVDSGVYGDDGEFFVGEQGTPTPPIFRASMPWDATLGIQLAKTHLQMYRLESQIDGRLHTALTSGQLVYNGLDEDGEQKVIHSHKKGQNLIFLPEDADVAPMEVPTEAVEMGETRLSNKEDAMYKTAYETIGSEEGQMSATEASTRNQATAAAVATLASTIESAEQTALRLIAQAVDIMSYGGPQPQDPGVSSDWTSIEWDSVSVGGESGE